MFIKWWTALVLLFHSIFICSFLVGIWLRLAWLVSKILQFYVRKEQNICFTLNARFKASTNKRPYFFTMTKMQHNVKCSIELNSVHTFSVFCSVWQVINMLFFVTKVLKTRPVVNLQFFSFPSKCFQLVQNGKPDVLIKQILGKIFCKTVQAKCTLFFF